MICVQPAAHQNPAPHQVLVFKGVLDLPAAIEKFGNRMPKLSEFDELVRQGPNKQPHPELVAKKRGLPARSGTILAHPAENSAFPHFLEFTDRQTGKKICLDTKQYANQRGIALVLEPGAYTFKFDGNRMLILPSTDPITIPDFPQFPGWYPYHKDTGVPVVSGGIVDPSGPRPERFLQRTPDAWIGMPARSINGGNYEEKYIYTFARPSLPQAIFIWETRLIQIPEASSGEERKIPRRRIIVPVSAPAPKKEEQKPEPEKPKITYHTFKHEWDIQRALHSIDPAHYSDPGTVPDQKTFETLLREGKIKIEK
ncbi:MAG: hypothetical protein NTY83_04060, partial [Candidatus Micrarchaeota archaeon]|nr:hypothetical protein [Candidatus Micrarchaeota archaeon]